MERYLVQDRVVVFGPGTVLQLTPEQLAPRRHNVSIEAEDETGAIVRTTTAVQFKSGETVVIEGAPPKSVSLVVAAEYAGPAGDDGDPTEVAVGDVLAAAPRRRGKR